MKPVQLNNINVFKKTNNVLVYIFSACYLIAFILFILRVQITDYKSRENHNHGCNLVVFCMPFMVFFILFLMIQGPKILFILGVIIVLFDILLLYNIIDSGVIINDIFSMYTHIMMIFACILWLFLLFMFIYYIILYFYKKSDVLKKYDNLKSYISLFSLITYLFFIIFHEDKKDVLGIVANIFSAISIIIFIIIFLLILNHRFNFVKLR